MTLASVLMENAMPIDVAVKGITRLCNQCGKKYSPVKESQRFCNLRCSNTATQSQKRNGAVIACFVCGGPVYVRLSQYKRLTGPPRLRCEQCRERRQKLNA